MFNVYKMAMCKGVSHEYMAVKRGTFCFTVGAFAHSVSLEDGQRQKDIPAYTENRTVY